MGYLNNQLEKVAFNLANLTAISIPASLGAGALLSDKDSAMDKLKTGLATGAGAVAGIAPLTATAMIVDNRLQPVEDKARRVWRKLLHSTDTAGVSWYKSLGKDRAKYEHYAPMRKMKPEDMMEWARKAMIRKKAMDKVWHIVQKVEKNNSIKRNKLYAKLPPLTLAAASLGGYLGYKYMED